MAATLAIGNKEQIAVATESVYGTPEAVASTGYYLGRDTKFTNPDIKQGFREILPANGGMQIEDKQAGEKRINFTLEWIFTDARFMRYVLSVDSETGTDPYTHTMTVPDLGSVDSFTLERVVKEGVLVETYSGCFIKDFQISWQNSADKEGFIKIIANCSAKQRTTDASGSTITYTLPEPFSYNKVCVTLNNGEIVEIQSGNYGLNTGINPDELYFANCTEGTGISEPTAILYRSVLNLNLAFRDDAVNDMWELRDQLSGTNKIEFVKNDTTDKVTINFDKVWNMDGINPTEFETYSKIAGVWDATISSIVAIDSIQNY